MRENAEKGGLDITDDSTIWDDLGLTGLYRKIGNRKWMLLLIPIIWIAFGNIAFRLSEDVYSGELHVVSGTLSNHASNAGGLGDLLGSTGIGATLQAVAPTDGMFSVYVESWTAPWFADELLKNTELTRRIFSDEWSSETGGWREPVGWRQTIVGAVKLVFGGRAVAWTPPDAEAILSYLRDHVRSQRNRGEVTTSIIVEAKDRDLTRDLLQFGHKRISEHLAKIFQDRADANIKYILQHLQNVSIADYRRALIDDLEEQEKLKMMAFANPEFAAQPLGMYIGTMPVRPRVISVILAALLLSVVFYFGLVVLADKLNWPKLADSRTGAVPLVKSRRA